jgi:hypothetical protein
MAARGKRFPWEDKLLRSGYLLGAVLLHLIIFALLAGYVVFRSPPQEPAVQFTPFNPDADATAGDSSARRDDGRFSPVD